MICIYSCLWWGCVLAHVFCVYTEVCTSVIHVDVEVYLVCSRCRCAEMGGSSPSGHGWARASHSELCEDAEATKQGTLTPLTKQSANRNLCVSARPGLCLTHPYPPTTTHVCTSNVLGVKWCYPCKDHSFGTFVT